jgi:hypothetical protein
MTKTYADTAQLSIDAQLLWVRLRHLLAETDQEHAEMVWRSPDQVVHYVEDDRLVLFFDQGEVFYDYDDRSGTAIESRHGMTTWWSPKSKVAFCHSGPSHPFFSLALRDYPRGDFN